MFLHNGEGVGVIKSSGQILVKKESCRNMNAINADKFNALKSTRVKDREGARTLVFTRAIEPSSYSE